MIRTGLGIAHPWLCDSMGHLNTRHSVAMFDDASAHYLAARKAIAVPNEFRQAAESFAVK